ncbi:MAG: CpaF family protein [Clostridia bacterium]|nr:CpaF family protein [Clostridia bacterium]
MSKKIDFWVLLSEVQEFIAQFYSATLSDEAAGEQIKSYISKFLFDNDVECEDCDTDSLIDRLYREMVEYSVLTPYLNAPNLEEINVNAWDDIAVTYLDGSIHKCAEKFNSPQHAVDILKRLLHNSGMVIDNATPMAQGHLPNNTRITVLKAPVVDEENGISASIRLLHPQRINLQKLMTTDFATKKMLQFLCMCMRYGVSMVMAGATSTGKTTLLNCLLTTIPDNKRVYTIESGARELSLVRRNPDGSIRNNVVHTLSRPSENANYDISQEKLVVASLRFNPDIICVGEMRDVEAYSAVEASLTGHTVVSSVHASGSAGTHMRIALLCQKKFPIDFGTSLIQAAQAFPIVVFTHRLENNDRKIMEISEAEVLPNGETRYRTLFNYNITKNNLTPDGYEVEGYFDQPEIMSESLKRKLLQYGVPQPLLQQFLTKD